MPAAAVKVGDLIANKYIVERLIAEGGMGVVFAALHRELQRRVAIKVLRPEMAVHAVAVERFKREARSAARVQGAHVCRVLDIGTLDGALPFMVMEYLEGHDLASELRQRGRIPAHEAVAYVLQACEGLVEAHAAGVIHRDLKPANLFLESCSNGARRIKVLDFGVSKPFDDTPMDELTKNSNLVGSPLYMSPEQLQFARDVDTRTDVWSLGVVLFELLSGQTPFSAATIPRLVTAILHERPRVLSGVAPELEAVVLRALEKSRSARYASVAEFGHALSSLAEHHAPQQQTKRARSDARPAGTPLSWTHAASPAKRRGSSRIALLLVPLVLGIAGVRVYTEFAVPQATAATAAVPVEPMAQPPGIPRPATDDRLPASQPTAAAQPIAQPSDVPATADSSSRPISDTESPTTPKPALVKNAPASTPRKAGRVGWYLEQPKAAAPGRATISDFGGRR